MKKLLLAGLTFLSMNAFSQSYLVLNNGVVLTTDKAGYVYDFGHFRLPYKVTLSGGQFFVEDKMLATIDSNGFLYQKTLKVEKIKGKGLNYFINDDNHLVTVDSKGFFYDYDKEDKVFKKAIKFGGNFFLVQPDDKKPVVELYTVSSTGNYFKMSIPGLTPANISTIGGNFFQANGVTYTVSKDGFVFPKKEIAVKKILKSGGNYFIDSDKLIYTVTDEGFLVLPALPEKFKVADVQKLGANYMVDSEGRIFTVDMNGVLFERTTTHDIKSVKILSL